MWTGPPEGWGKYQAVRRAAKIAAGICRYCTEPAAAGLKNCRYHADYYRTYAKAYRAARLERKTGFRMCARVYLTQREVSSLLKLGDPATVLKSLAMARLREMKRER